MAKFVRAYESADLDAVVALLTDDAFISMPPMPFEYEGRDAVARFCASIFDAGRRFDLVPTRANGQPAFGTYLHAPDGTRHGVGLLVLTVSGDLICAMTRFENAVLPWFGLPRTSGVDVIRCGSTPTHRFEEAGSPLMAVTCPPASLGYRASTS